MKLIIQPYTREIFIFTWMSRYCVWFPGYIYNVCTYLSNIHFENISTFFPDQKSMETRKKYIHTGARRRGEKKKQKAGIKWEKEGKRGKPRIELVERKGEERQSEKESSFTRIRIQSACGVRTSRIPSVTYFQSLSRYFPSHAICFKPILYENERSEIREMPSLPLRFFWMRGHEPTRYQERTILELA